MIPATQCLSQGKWVLSPWRHKGFWSWEHVVLESLCQYCLAFWDLLGEGSLGLIRERDYTPRHLSAGLVWCSAWRDSHLETSPPGLPSAARLGLGITSLDLLLLLCEVEEQSKLPCWCYKLGPWNSLTSSFHHSISFCWCFITFRIYCCPWWGGA